MSGEEKHGVVRSVRRFFWLPRRTPREPVPVPPLLQTWLFGLAVGAAVTALGWEEATLMVAVWVELEMLRSVVDGVRHRWPAFVSALAVGWSVDRLASAGLPDPGAPWGVYAVYAVWTLAALTTFAAVTRLPRRQAS